VKLFSALVHGEGVIIGQRGVPQHTTEVTQILPADGTAGRPFPQLPAVGIARPTARQ
jgi:hypothetical protein